MQQLIQGNEACALGAMLAGCSFFAGYPISPSSEIMEMDGAAVAGARRRVRADGGRDRLDGSRDRRQLDRVRRR